jgi:hypothetical protein
MNVCESTRAERELLDSKLVDFNRKNVPFQQSEDWIDLSYLLKDEIGIGRQLTWLRGVWHS